MKRDIKVRGYAIEKLTGTQWVYGTGILRTKFTEEYAKEKGKSEEYLILTESGWVEVEPESVGQTTELFDLNGQDVYEGDIFEIGKNVYVIEYNRPRYEMVDMSDDDIKIYLPIDSENGQIKSIMIATVFEQPELLKRRVD